MSFIQLTKHRGSHSHHTMYHLQLRNDEARYFVMNNFSLCFLFFYILSYNYYELVEHVTFIKFKKKIILPFTCLILHGRVGTYGMHNTAIPSIHAYFEFVRTTLLFKTFNFIVCIFLQLQNKRLSLLL